MRTVSGEVRRVGRDDTDDMWREQVIDAARKALDDLRATDAFGHAEMIEDLEALIARLSATPPAPQGRQAPAT